MTNYNYEYQEIGLTDINDIDKTTIIIANELPESETQALEILGVEDINFINPDIESYKKLTELKQTVREKNERQKIQSQLDQSYILGLKSIPIRRTYRDYDKEQLEQAKYKYEKTSETLERINSKNPNISKFILGGLKAIKMTDFTYEDIEKINNESLQEVSELEYKISLTEEIDNISDITVYPGPSRLYEDGQRVVADAVTMYNDIQEKLIIIETPEGFENLHPSIKSRCNLLKDGVLYKIQLIK